MRYNERFIQILGQMAQQTTARGEHFKAQAYRKAQETIQKFGIKNLEELKGMPGIGKSILEVLSNADRDPFMGNQKVAEDPHILFIGIYGIGPKKAAELVESGIKTIEKLRELQNDVLNDKQIIGLKYYEDVLKRIPRNEIHQYNKVINSSMFRILCRNKFEQEDAELEIVGSFRRGASDSGDIDVIITAKFPQIFALLIDDMIKNGVILEVLSRGSSKCLVMAKIPGASVVRRVDFLYSPPDEYAFSILYFTGSKEFNTAMRTRALEFGLTLNEHGFHHMVEGVNGRKVKGEKVDQLFKDEKEIFDHLRMIWKEPHERKDGSSIITY